MKIEQQRKKLGQEGYTEILDYQIEASSKAFEILFKNVYSDPIKAILRELGTNAYDSHVEAGNVDQPFDIHLPTVINPLFYIRDYGVGLNGDELKNIYRVVFKSTKTSSNEQIGCFGLGCKTPFAYTDNYLIESFKDGKRYACNAFYNNTSKPALAFTVDGEPTTEPNGLKVTLIVKAGDISTWYDRAKEVYRYFKVKPNFLGQSIKIEPIKYIMSGTNWSLRSGDSYGNSHICAIMGQIPYRINVSSVKGLLEKEKILANCGIDIFFNIGDLAVEANREGIHLNDRSCLAIQTKLSSIIKELSKQIEDSVKSESCLWDASLKAKSIFSNFYSLKNIIELKNLNYKGNKLLDLIYLETSLLEKITVSSVEMSYRKNPKKFSKSKIDVRNTYFFLKDSDSIENRIKKYFIDNNINDNIAVLIEENEPDPNNPTTTPNTGVKDFCELIGIPEDRLIKTSTLPKPPRAKRTVNRAKTSKVNLLKNHAWEDASIDIKNGSGFYVEMFQTHTIYRVRINPQKQTTTPTVRVSPYRESKIYLPQLLTLKESMDRLGFPVYNIYGIRSSLVPKLGSGWKSYYKYAQSKLAYILDVYSFEKIKKPHIPSNSVLCPNVGLLDELSKVINKDTDLFQLIKLSKDIDYRKEIITKLTYYCSWFGEKPNIKIIDKQSEVDKIIEKYYLLSKITPWSINNYEKESFVKSVANYVNLLGEKK